MTKIGVIADTHGLLRDEVIELLKECQVILHAGDINKPEIIETLKKIAPLYVVRGNNDKGEWAEALPKFIEERLYGYVFYMTHQKKDVPNPIPNVDFIITGHSHKYAEEDEKSPVWLNPGSCGKRRFGLEISMAILEVTDAGIKVVKKQLVPPSNA
ncbi:MAG: metallophosphoesterase family protein [Cellulosilyticum sp.]|nr:metallophosphoesterase family protein [Cellulosilyticum sp.]